MTKPKQPEPFAAYVIGHRDDPQVHVAIGTRGDAHNKMAALALADYNRRSDSEREDWMTAARRASARSGFEYFRQVMRWKLSGPFEFSIAVKP